MKCWNFGKNIQKFYLGRALVFRTVKDLFGRFRQNDYNIISQSLSGRTSDVDEDALVSIKVLTETYISQQRIAI